MVSFIYGFSTSEAVDRATWPDNGSTPAPGRFYSLPNFFKVFAKTGYNPSLSQSNTNEIAEANRIMNDHSYSITKCDCCGEFLQAHRRDLDRWVMQFEYNEPDDMSGIVASAIIHEAHGLAHYCGLTCSSIGSDRKLRKEGIVRNNPGPGPLETCSKCGVVVDRSQPHVAYELLDMVEVQTSAGNSYVPQDSTTLAIICSQCESKVLHYKSAAQRKREHA